MENVPETTEENLVNATSEKEEKKFTQAELDAVIGKRLAEERAKTGSEEISKITAAKDAAEKNYQETLAKLERMRHERLLMSFGVPADDVDYYDFKISQLVSKEKNYETAAKEFLKEKPVKPNVRFDTGAGFGGAKEPTTSSVMNDLIRSGARR